jgi:hypothetical protein
MGPPAPLPPVFLRGLQASRKMSDRFATVCVCVWWWGGGCGAAGVWVGVLMQCVLGWTLLWAVGWETPAAFGCSACVLKRLKCVHCAGGDPGMMQQTVRLAPTCEQPVRLSNQYTHNSSSHCQAGTLTGHDAVGCGPEHLLLRIWLLRMCAKAAVRHHAGSDNATSNNMCMQPVCARDQSKTAVLPQHSPEEDTHWP